MSVVSGNVAFKFPPLYIVRCPGLQNPANGMVSETGNSPGDMATYICDSNYDLVGDPMRVCGEDGIWSGQAPMCIGKYSHNQA